MLLLRGQCFRTQYRILWYVYIMHKVSLLYCLACQLFCILSKCFSLAYVVSCALGCSMKLSVDCVPVQIWVRILDYVMLPASLFWPWPAKPALNSILLKRAKKPSWTYFRFMLTDSETLWQARRCRLLSMLQASKPYTRSTYKESVDRGCMLAR